MMMLGNEEISLAGGHQGWKWWDQAAKAATSLTSNSVVGSRWKSSQAATHSPKSTTFCCNWLLYLWPNASWQSVKCLLYTRVCAGMQVYVHGVPVDCRWTALLYVKAFWLFLYCTTQKAVHYSCALENRMCLSEYQLHFQYQVITKCYKYVCSIYCWCCQSF